MSSTLSKDSNLMKKLIKDCKIFYKINKKNIFDIILYGSVIRGKAKPRDIDILVIFNQADKKQYYEIPYELRKQLEVVGKKIKFDVKGIYIKELFDSKFLARSSILYEGYSLTNKVFIANQLGFENYCMFTYNLKNLTNSQKTLFQYALNGRRQAVGMIETLKAQHLSPGTILVPVNNSEEFKDFLNTWNIKFEEHYILMKKAL